MELNAAFTMIVGMVLLATPAHPLPTGAPLGACVSLTPPHGTDQTGASPYTINVDQMKYRAGYTIKVTVSGSNFMGILMQVRKAGTPTNATVYGTWSSPPANTKLMTCTNAADSVTHANTNNKQNAVFTWKAPQGVTDDLEVIATVAQAKAAWWKALKSNTLTHDPTLTTVAPSMSTRIGPSAGSVFMAILVALFTLRFY